MEDTQWTSKYVPKTIEDIMNNKKNINDICKNIEKGIKKNIYIMGKNGIGKKTVCNLILEKYKYKIINITHNDIINSTIIDDILMNRMYYKKEKYGLIINKIENITLEREENTIINLCEINKKENIMDIMIISNDNYNKMNNEIKKLCIQYDFDDTTNKDIIYIINKISKNENIKYSNENIINNIINYVNGNIRKLMCILYDLYLTGLSIQKNKNNNVIIDESILRKVILNYEMLRCNNNIYEITNYLLNNYKSIDDALYYYEINKVLLSLMIYEKYRYKCKDVLVSNLNKKNNKMKIQNIFDIYRKVSYGISNGDIIETNIYTEQNWINQKIHGFYTICYTSYNINKIEEKVDFGSYYASEYNKASLRCINKKNNIEMIQNVIGRYNLNRLLHINKVLYELVERDEYENTVEICKYYGMDYKNLEKILKINKLYDKMNFNIKYKKIN